MYGLDAAMNIGLSGLQANQAALDVVGHNIANVNTPGYSRQQVQLSTNFTQSQGTLQFGNGVNVASIFASRNKFLDLQISQSIAGQNGAQTRYQGVQAVASAFTEDDTTGINAQIQKFFTGLGQVASAPEDGAMRTNMLGAAQSLATALKSRYQTLTDGVASANDQVGQTVIQINTLTAQIASLNDRIATEPSPGSDNDGRDQRQAATDKLAALVGIRVYEDNNSRYQITLDTGAAVLVSGNTAYKMSATTDTTLSNNYRVDVAQGSAVATNVTAQIKGGILGANLDLRDNVLNTYMTQLDEVSAGIAGAVNLQNRAGFDLNGNAGGDVFQGAVIGNGANGLPTTVSAANNYKGMTSSLTVNAAMLANPSLIAASDAAGEAGNNNNALAMGKLQTATNTVDSNGDGVGDSGPFSTTVTNLVNLVGTQSQTYLTTATTQENLNSALTTQRASVSGVDLDEEAASLLTYQRGYQASARFINVISTLTDQLIQNLGR